MRHVRPTSPAARRARRCTAGGLLSLAVTVGGIALAATDRPWGLAIALPCLVVAAALLAHNVDLATIAAVGDVPVAALAVPASVLAARMTPADVLRRLAADPEVHHHLVAGPDGWRSVASSLLMDHALAGAGAIPVAELGRPTRHVAPTTPVDRLPRPPLDGELWVVGERRPPVVLTHAQVLAHRDGARTVVLPDHTGPTPADPARTSTGPVPAGPAETGAAEPAATPDPVPSPSVNA